MDELGPVKERLDVSKIFLAYLATCGDVVLAADIAECSISDVLYLAKSELWDIKLAESQRARGGTLDKAKEKGREINRMANYIQATRLRSLIDKTLHWIYENPENINKFCQETNKQGNKFFSTKPLLDLAKAAESVQSMTYRSLGDSMPKGENAMGQLGSIRDLHLTVIEAMKQTVPDEKGVSEILLHADRIAIPEPTSVNYIDVAKALE